MYEYVPKYYEMDPTNEDLLFDSLSLVVGMKVLTGDPNLRCDLTDQRAIDTDADFIELAKRRNRWFTITYIDEEIRNNGRYTNLALIAVFDDGTKRKLLVEKPWPWIVKLATLNPVVFSDTPEKTTTFEFIPNEASNNDVTHHRIR